jgi:hypothetical protein
VNIHLGVVGDASCLAIVREISKEYPDFSPQYFEVQSLEQVTPIMNAFAIKMDMWLLLGQQEYAFVQTKIKPQQPVFYVPYRGASLFKVLCRIFYMHKLQVSDLSFDTVPYKDIIRGLEEMCIVYEGLFSYVDSSVYKSVEEIADRHYAFWKQGKTKAAVTCIGAVQTLLEKRKMPVFRVLPVRLSIRSMFFNMLREFDLQIVRDAQIAVQVFEFDMLRHTEKIYSADEMYNEEIKLTQKLIAYAMSIQGSLKPAGQGRFFVFTTRGMLSGITKQFTVMPDMGKFGFQEEELIACGIGIGLSASQAELHAVLALQQASRCGRGSWMVYSDQQMITGPLGKNEQLTYMSISDDLLKMSQKTSINSKTLGKIAAIVQKQRSPLLSAQQLARYLHILPRSARRILTQLEEAGIAVVAGKDNPGLRGRPKNLYAIKIGQD